MKIVNVVLAIGCSIIVGALITLGIKAFYPEPQYPSYPNPIVSGPCATADLQCQKLQTQQQKAYDDAEQAYENTMQVYNRNLFIIANVVGIIVFAIGFWILFSISIAAQGAPIGVMMAGMWAIIYGYGRGWGSIDDKLKFFVGLVIAAIVIGGSIWLMQRNAHRHGSK